jgi:hypothetical protein
VSVLAAQAAQSDFVIRFGLAACTLGIDHDTNVDQERNIARLAGFTKRHLI